MPGIINRYNYIAFKVWAPQIICKQSFAAVTVQKVVFTWLRTLTIGRISLFERRQTIRTHAQRSRRRGNTRVAKRKYCFADRCPWSFFGRSGNKTFSRRVGRHIYNLTRDIRGRDGKKGVRRRMDIAAEGIEIRRVSRKLGHASDGNNNLLVSAVIFRETLEVISFPKDMGGLQPRIVLDFRFAGVAMDGESLINIDDNRLVTEHLKLRTTASSKGGRKGRRLKYLWIFNVILLYKWNNTIGIHGYPKPTEELIEV